jgi:hypothetical protein
LKVKYGKKKQMYCEVCGNPLKEDDSFCKVCGTSGKGVVFTLEETPIGQTVINEETNNHSKELEQTEQSVQIEQTEQSKQTEQTEQSEQTEFIWNIHDFPKPKKTEEIDFDWGDADLKKTNQSVENIDEYFTFNKENEEFQKTLDREYEKIEKQEPIPDIPLPLPNIVQQDEQKDENENLTPLWFEKGEDENEKEKQPENKKQKQKKGWIGKIILILVIIILLAEIICLGIKFFRPESEAAKQITTFQITIVRTLTDWKDHLKEKIGNDETITTSKEKQTETVIAEPVVKDNIEQEQKKPVFYDPVPAVDKNILIKSQISNNKNIQTIRANKGLAYQVGRDYKIADINNSKPIENNIWTISEDGKAIFYDQEIVATLIAFDSQWNDYVNGGSKDVIELTKKGSKAYRNVTTFSKVGKVKQTFLLLEIGEFRKGSKGFYAWTYEEIKEVEGRKVNNKKYHWIYYIEPIDGKMKIVDYYKY